MDGGQCFHDKRAKGGNRKVQSRRLGYDQAIKYKLLTWLLDSRDLHLPVSKMILTSFFFQDSHNVMIVFILPLASCYQYFAEDWIPDSIVDMITAYAAVDLIYSMNCIAIAISSSQGN